ncbi:MAG: electron transport complex subunit RsxC [Candidatus Aminicenantes bacterium]|nr:MAG: electron transport complex subunit RsxC [Candidatus Aminicenantes bacterium]
MKIRTFPRGIHPPEFKEWTAESAIESLPASDKIMIPLLQHFGAAAQPLVKKGDEVTLGQKVGEGKALFSASVHSSVSGKVLSVDDYNHPGGNPVAAVTISNDGEDRLFPENEGVKDPFSLSPDEIRQRVRDAGVVGLGGAAFPTAVKLSPPKDKPIDTIVINGCECEPMLTADYRLMLESPEDILKGAELARIATGAERIIVGIEDNKKKAFELIQEKIQGIQGEVALLKTKYPQGAEKNLIYALLKREVPRGGLPFDVGIVVQNVGTAKAIWEAVNDGKPLYERAITVSGNGIEKPKNILVRVGTPFQNVIEFCGGLDERADILVMGGPMMGISQWSLDTPVIKGTSGILAWTSPAACVEYPCIRCSRCVEHCPNGLVPTQLAKYVRFDDLAEAEKWGILDCVECGCCQYICPSRIPLVHWMRLGKNKIASLKRKKSA